MTREEIRRTTLENLIAGLLPENQQPVRRELARRETKGRQLSTNLTWAAAWQRLQRCHPDRTFSSLSPEEWLRFVGWMREQPLADTTIYTTCACLKASLARVLGAKEIPPDILDALDVDVPEVEKEGHVLDDASFHLLLEFASQEGERYQTPAHVALKQALLWTFWDTGFRGDELRSLNIGDVQFMEDGGAYIGLCSKKEAIRRDCRLKTGPRRIYIVECVAPIKAWLALHPDGTDPHAPLFLGFRIRQGKRIAKLVLGNWIRDLGAKADLSQKWGVQDNLGGHDFRHTRITRAARDNWHPTKLSMYFWGIPESKEAKTYAHIADSDLREQVRRDLGLDSLGYRTAPAPLALTQAMIEDAVRRILAEQLGPRGTQRPMPSA